MTFQLTRSVGSVTFTVTSVIVGGSISTHTLRGERDTIALDTVDADVHFNSHAPWGA